MKISKKSAILFTTYILSAFFIFGGFLIQAKGANDSLELRSSNEYSHAFLELATALEEMNVSLQKATYANTPPMISAVCADVYAKSIAASIALSALPYSNTEFENTAAFISKTGDFALSLIKQASSGQSYSAETLESLSSLSKTASELANKFTLINAGVVSGEFSFSHEALDAADDAAAASGLTESFKAVETEFPELPSLIYDGPFSEHISNMSPRLLEGLGEISQEDAILTASQFIGIDRNRLKCEYTRNDDVPVYAISSNNDSSPLYFEITVTGGKVLYFNNTRIVTRNVLDTEIAVQKAEKFLRTSGFSSMKTTYWTVEEGRVIVNFAYEQNGVVCYPDLVKVTVALDNGDIVGFESLGYIMSHTARSIPQAKISEEKAKGQISENITVLSSGSSIIPTSGKNEVFCYEFLCEDKEGHHVLVYINAETGYEEKILILLEDENGTLTI